MDIIMNRDMNMNMSLEPGHGPGQEHGHKLRLLKNLVISSSSWLMIKIADLQLVGTLLECNLDNWHAVGNFHRKMVSS
jgi:hypothetical protein